MVVLNVSVRNPETGEWTQVGTTDELLRFSPECYVLVSEGLEATLLGISNALKSGSMEFSLTTWEVNHETLGLYFGQPVQSVPSRREYTRRWRNRKKRGRR